MSNLKQGLEKLKAKGLKKGSKKKFPDLSGDGKVTMKDILMGRGVVKAGRGDFIAKLAKKRKSLSGSNELARFDKEMKMLLSPKAGSTKGMTQAQIKRMLDRIKRESAQKVTAKRANLVGKGTSDAAKIGVGAAATLTTQEIDKAKKLKAAKKRGSKKSSKTSKADIIGKGSPKGRAQGGMVTKGQGAAIRGTKFKGTF